VLGCGRIALGIHLPVLAGMADVAVAAVADPDDGLREKASALVPRAARFRDFAELLASAAIDAVVITLPNALHVPASTAALRRGLHVYLEKPLAPDLCGGLDVLRAWRAAGTVAMVGYNYRFLRSYQQARELVRSGRIGNIVAIRSTFATSRREAPAWKQRREHGGGALLDLASHHLDMAAWIIGEPPCSVTCDLLSRHSDDDTAVLQLEFPGGVPVQILAAFAAPETHRFEILGEHGRLLVDVYGADAVEAGPATLDRVRLERFVAAARAIASPRYWLSKVGGSHLHMSYRHALRSFVDGALTGQQPQPDVAEGCAALAWMDAARESARDGRKAIAVAFSVS
jgi:predicted dehydrogenase